MTKKKVKIPKSIKKHIRSEKMRIRRTVSDFEEQKKRVQEVYEKFGLVMKTEHDNK